MLIKLIQHLLEATYVVTKRHCLAAYLYPDMTKLSASHSKIINHDQVRIAI